jgi:LysR family hydrogen peroxide-inducible transcriptional activator
MTLQELTYLVAVADHLHFGRAAAACHVTQPTLSAGLRSLESKLGLVLCERGPRRVRITRAGEPIVAQARQVLAAARRVEQLAHHGQAPLCGDFRLGAIPTIGPYLLPHVIPAIRAAWPDLRLRLVEATTADLLTDLHRGELDLALLSPPLDDAGLEAAPLYREDFLLAVPTGHRLAGKRSLRLADLEDEALLLLDEGHCLRDQVLEFCRLSDTMARDLIRSSSLETLRNMVTAGLGCTLLPALALRDHEGLKVRRMVRPAPSREVGLYWSRADARAESARLLAATMVDHLPDLVRRV